MVTPGRNRDGEAADEGAGAVSLDELYDRAVAALLDVSVEEAWLETDAGRTHALLAGDPSAPPVVVLQGGNVTNPITLSWCQSLADEYRLIAPDTVGEPGKSAAVAPSSYGEWVVDVLDALGLDRTAMVGISHGGGVLLETAATAPERISAAALVVPAGFGTPLSWDLLRVILPSLAYRYVPRSRFLIGALEAMFTQPVETVDEVTLETIATALRTADLDTDFPGPDGSDALSAFDAPTLVVAGERDPFFPGDRIRDRVDRTLSSPVDYRVLPGERHFLSPTCRADVTAAIRSILEAHSSR